MLLAGTGLGWRVLLREKHYCPAMSTELPFVDALVSLCRSNQTTETMEYLLNESSLHVK
jgi:hypothetical protein